MTGLIAILTVIDVILCTGNKLVAAGTGVGETPATLFHHEIGSSDSKATQALQRRLATAGEVGELLLALTLMTMIVGAEVQPSLQNRGSLNL